MARQTRQGTWLAYTIEELKDLGLIDQVFLTPAEAIEHLTAEQIAKLPKSELAAIEEHVQDLESEREARAIELAHQAEQDAASKIIADKAEADRLANLEADQAEATRISELAKEAELKRLEALGSTTAAELAEVATSREETTTPT
jgi:hypothetical protein